MNFRGDLPIYLQVMERIKKDIANNIISPGDKLPSTRELSLRFTINPNTAARVYRELEEEGLTFTLRGRGTFVTEDSEKVAMIRGSIAKKAVSSFLEEMYEMNFTLDDILDILEKHREE